MRHVRFNNWNMLIGIIIMMNCNTSNRSGDDIKIQSDLTIFQIDTTSLAFRIVNDSKMKKFYFDFYVTEPWSSSGYTKSVFADSIIQDSQKSIPTLISYLSSSNDSIRIVAYVLLTESTGQFSGLIRNVTDGKKTIKIDSLRLIFANWWKNDGLNSLKK